MKPAKPGRPNTTWPASRQRRFQKGARVGGVERSGFSQDPVDRLIRALIRTGRDATLEEVDRIVHRMATAPPDRRALPVPRRLRGSNYLGRTLGARAEAFFRHLVERVVDEQQWSWGTTEDRYLGDLASAVLDPSARLMVYNRRGENIAAVFAENVVSEERKGQEALPYIFVVYSADRGKIITGYQISGLGEVSIPEGFGWLR